MSSRPVAPLVRISGVLVIAMLLASCATAPTSPQPQEPPSRIERLRARASEAPRDAQLQLELAVAEMWSAGGESERVPAQLQRAARVAPDDARLHLLRGVYADLHGTPATALDHYLSALEQLDASRVEHAAWIAEIASVAARDLHDGVDAFAAQAEPRLKALSERGDLPAAARFQVASLRTQLALRRGDADAARTLAAKAGCVSEWRVAGPFGPRVLLGFDEPPQIDPGRPFEDHYDLAPGHEDQATREEAVLGCTVQLGAPDPRGGITYAEAVVDVERAGDHLLRVETPNAVEVFVDGRSVRRLDARRVPTPRVSFVPVSLPAGRHRVVLRVATRHPNPAFSLAVLRRMPGLDADGFQRIRLPRDREVASSWNRYLRAAVAMDRGDTVRARELLRAHPAGMQAPGAVLVHRAAVALSDPLVPPQRARDQARRLLAAARRRDADLWYPAMQLARLDAENGRTMEAVERLREAVERWPRVVALRLLLVRLLQEQGWQAEAETRAHAAVEAFPDTCGILETWWQTLRRRDRSRRAAEVAERLVACDAQSNARYSTDVARRRWQQASQELERLATFQSRPDGYGALLGRVELAKNSGEPDDVEAALQALRERFPSSTDAVRAHVDWLIGAGRREEALKVLDDATQGDPAAMAPLRRLRVALGRQHVMEPYRRDGLEAIEALEGSDAEHSEPQVLVLDYMAVRVFQDGSSLQLIHTVRKAQSREAVNELGEFSLPDNASLWKLRTIKSDGRVLEPDAISGKESLSLPQLEVGDYVEAEMIRYVDPPAGFPGGYLGDRFYFRSFEVPFHHSELVMALPDAMPVTLEPRGPLPEAQREDRDDLQVYRWKVERSESAEQEPMSVSAREYLPSISVGVRAGWDAFVTGIRDLLVDRDIRDPAARRLARRVAGPADEADPSARVRRLYRWVLANVEHSDEAFGQAVRMLKARKGHRVRVLHYLLELAGIPSQLALARSASADAEPSKLADGETFEHLLLRLPRLQPPQPGRDAVRRTSAGSATREPVWLSAVERWAPFGHLPPLLRGQPARLLDPEGTRVRLPDSRAGSDRHEAHVDVHLQEDGSARVEVSERFHGAPAAAWREQLESIPAAQLRTVFAQQYVARLVPGASLKSLEVEAARDPARPLVLRYAFDTPILARPTDAGLALPGMFPSRLGKTYASLAERETTQLLNPPVERRLVVKLRIPAEGALSYVPPEVSLDGPGSVAFEHRVRRHEDGVTLVRELRVPVARVAPSRYPELARFCQAVDALEKQELQIGLDR